MNSNEYFHKKMRAVDKTLTSVPHKLLHVFQRSLYGKTRPCSFIAVEKKYSVRGTSSTIRRIEFPPPPDGQLVDKCWNTRQRRTVGHWNMCSRSSCTILDSFSRFNRNKHKNNWVQLAAVPHHTCAPTCAPYVGENQIS